MDPQQDVSTSRGTLCYVYVYVPPWVGHWVLLVWFYAIRESAEGKGYAAA